MRLLVLLPRFPYPLDKGDKLRAYHQIVELAKRHEVHLFALSHHAVAKEYVEQLRPYCASIHIERLQPLSTWLSVVHAFFTGAPLQVGYWTTRRARRAYRNYCTKWQPEAQYAQMIRTVKYLNDTEHGGIDIRVLDFQDALSLNVQRRIERTRGLLRWVLQYEVQALRRAEQEAIVRYRTTIISPQDRSAIDNNAIAIVPNGIDTQYFTRPQASSVRYDILFSGNMAYAPNVDAARYLVEEVMPIVWRQHPSATVLLAGADPKPAVRALASERVIVSGRLPDIRTAYSSARIFIAPMRIGSGMQNKLLEAMAMQLPCITTPIAALPLGSTTCEYLLVGDTTEALAQHIITLMADASTCKLMGQNGRVHVQQCHSWTATIAPLENLLTNK